MEAVRIVQDSVRATERIRESGLSTGRSLCLARSLRSRKVRNRILPDLVKAEGCVSLCPHPPYRYGTRLDLPELLFCKYKANCCRREMSIIHGVRGLDDVRWQPWLAHGRDEQQPRNHINNRSRHGRAGKQNLELIIHDRKHFRAFSSRSENAEPFT